MAIIKLSATERRRVSAFFTCLVLAVFAWLFTVLSNPRKYTVRAVLKYKNAPQRRAFHSLQHDTVNVTIAGNGWDMLFSGMNPGARTITIDLQNLENKNYIVLSSQQNQINNNKELNRPIVGFDPDTLYFDFSNRKVKKVPLKVVTAISYKRQFTQSGNITLKPAYAMISGPESIIDKITEWTSDPLKLDSVDETVNTVLNVQPVNEPNMSIFPKTARVTIPVDEFTEKTLFVPVKLVNGRGYDIKIFPQKVKIIFTVPLSRYAETDEDFFEANADLDLWRIHNYKALPVWLNKIPSYCKLVRVEPQNIDFIIKR